MQNVCIVLRTSQTLDRRVSDRFIICRYEVKYYKIIKALCKCYMSGWESAIKRLSRNEFRTLKLNYYLSALNTASSLDALSDGSVFSNSGIQSFTLVFPNSLHSAA